MHLTDQAIVLSTRKLGESTGLVRVFGKEHGVLAGAVRGLSGKRARGIWQAGNIALVSWSARNDSQLGTLSGELETAVSAHAMQSPATLETVNAMATLVEKLLPERQPHPLLFHACEQVLHAIIEGKNWQEAYAHFELTLLSECGFRLDLTDCAATGTRENLVYVSPKSGRAVCREAGLPYHDKMLPLPAFLHKAATPSTKDIHDALTLTGYFLHHWVYAPHGWTLPAARGRLVSLLPSPAPSHQHQSPS